MNATPVMRARAALGAAVVLSLMLSVSPAQAAVTETSAPAVPVAEPPEVPPQHFPDADANIRAAETDTCATVRATLVKAGKRGLAGCVRPGDPEVARKWIAENKHAFGDVGTNAIVPLPQWCIDHPLTGWWGNRAWACRITTWTSSTVDLGTGVVIGESNVLETSYIFTSPSARVWGHQLQFRLINGWGSGWNTLSLEGTFSCFNQCSVGAGTRFPRQPVLTTSDANGEGYGDSHLGANAGLAIGTGYTSWRVQRYNPAWDGTGGVGGAFNLTTPLWVRCDRTLPGTTEIGCVHSVYVPVWSVSLTGRNPQFARHVLDAQASGLRGAYPDGVPLTRLTDPVRIAANRNRACPESYPRPTGMTCDEYPFASTWEGASTAVPQGPGRTFSYCQIAQLGAGSGPVGYSACMIPSGENSSAGGFLGGFFHTNRVIEGDQFRVRVTP